MKISIVQDIAVSPNAAKEDAAAVCAYPFSCRAPGGRIVCVYRQGTDKHSRDGVLMAQGSDDGGVSWGTPGLVYDGLSAAAPESVLVGLIGLDQNGELLAVFKVVAAEKPEVYIFSEEGRKIRSRFLVARSADNGETWAKPRELLLVNTPRDTYPGANPLRFPDGRILLPLEATGVHGEEFVIGAFYDAQANILAPAFEIAHDPTGLLSFGDPRLTFLGDGTLLMLLWTFRTRAEETIPAHYCLSGDHGRTWTPPQATNAPCQILSPLGWEGATVLAAGNVRTAPEGIRLFVSRNGGRTWEVDAPIALWDARESRATGVALPIGAPPPKGQAIWSELPAFTFGTPELFRVGQDEALMIYYAMRGKVTHIRACRFALTLD